MSSFDKLKDCFQDVLQELRSSEGLYCDELKQSDDEKVWRVYDLVFEDTIPYKGGIIHLTKNGITIVPKEVQEIENFTYDKGDYARDTTLYNNLISVLETRGKEAAKKEIKSVLINRTKPNGGGTIGDGVRKPDDSGAKKGTKRNLEDDDTADKAHEYGQQQESKGREGNKNYCTQCGHSLDSGSEYCTQCGAPISVGADEVGKVANQPSANKSKEQTISLFGIAIIATSLIVGGIGVAATFTQQSIPVRILAIVLAVIPSAFYAWLGYEMQSPEYKRLKQIAGAFVVCLFVSGFFLMPAYEIHKGNIQEKIDEIEYRKNINSIQSNAPPSIATTLNEMQLGRQKHDLYHTYLAYLTILAIIYGIGAIIARIYAAYHYS